MASSGASGNERILRNYLQDSIGPAPSYARDSQSDAVAEGELTSTATSSRFAIEYERQIVPLADSFEFRVHIPMSAVLEYDDTVLDGTGQFGRGELKAQAHVTFELCFEDATRYSRFDWKLIHSPPPPRAHFRFISLVQQRQSDAMC